MTFFAGFFFTGEDKQGNDLGCMSSERAIIHALGICRQMVT